MKTLKAKQRRNEKREATRRCKGRKGHQLITGKRGRRRRRKENKKTLNNKNNT